MDKHKDKDRVSHDTLLHGLLGAVVFTFAMVFVLWPELQGILA